MASSSCTSPTKVQRKHHVFLSFRGEDTRVCFTSHLHAALERKNLFTFIDDDLRRGEEISDSLVKAIEDSMLSVIIFSEKYASSRWCLKELVKILECRNRGQIVIPIFYKVDPSDVRNQSGSFGDAFADLVKRKALEMEEERRFRAALNETANISGHDSRNMESESKFIERIVKDILNKMSKMISCHAMNLVGIAERIREIESVLKMESQEVRIVGIWGMGGIGKTTIAGAVYNKICTEFEAFLFVPNIREELKRCTVVDLQRRFVSRLLDREIPDMCPLSFGNHLIKDGLRHKKVLIVFDDVDSSMPLQELLLGQHDSFGPGSRILVTSRDQHVLKQVVDATYEVKALKNHDALRLLKSKAFNKIYPTSDYKDLLDRTVNYAKGNPLVLVVLGSAICDRSKEDWYSKLNGLGQGQDVDILKVLRISYDGLSEEGKNVFLDIAYGFKGMDRDRVTPILEKKSSSVHFCISNLIYKSLITASGDILWMHDLLREMAYSIVNESKNPRKRRWLDDHEDIYDVLKTKKGREAVKGICLDMPASSKIRLKSDDFEGMRGLEFLIIKGNTSKVKLPRRGLKYLPEKLRYLRWDGYSSRSLAEKFCAANLVDFEFRGSEVENLWSGRQELVNLRRINLSDSHRLTKLPDLSEAKKLQAVNLWGCAGLKEVPSYFQYFEDLRWLDLTDCYNLQSLPSKINSKKMNHLSLNGCSNVKKIPEISANRASELLLCGTAIEERQQSFGGNPTILTLKGCSNITKFPKISGDISFLCLDGTAIDKVPSSIQFLTSLTYLSLNNCKKLSRLPVSICKLKSLEQLNMSGCSKLESFLEIKEPMESLTSLDLRRTAITELPSSIRFLPNLEVLGLTNCKKLSILPNSICGLKSLDELYLRRTAITELPSSIRFLTNLIYLDLSNCKKLSSLPNSICGLKSLVGLYLSGTAITELPSSIRFFTNLEALELRNCKKLSSLPNSICELKSLGRLYLSGTAITELPSSIGFLTNLKDLELSNCKKLSSLPNSICELKSLGQLYLSGTAITELPSSIRFLTNLIGLILSNCKKLSSLPNSICELKSLGELGLSGTAITELPELRPSLQYVSANGCESLEIISSSTVVGSMRQLLFADCFKLDQKALMEDLRLKIEFGKVAPFFVMVLPGSEIPRWFSYPSMGSNSITIQFPSNTPNLKAIAFCSVFQIPEWFYPYDCPVDIFSRQLRWEAKITGGELYRFPALYYYELSSGISESDHMYLSYRNLSHYGSFLGHEARFECVVSGGMERQPFHVKMCGVHLIYENAGGLGISDDEMMSDDGSG